MSSWGEVERQFSELALGMERAILERQWDETSEEWRLAGSVALAAANSFRLVASSAGALLTGAGAVVPPEVAEETDAQQRWFRALWFMAGPHEAPVVGLMSLHGRASAGPVSVGRIRRPAHLSAALALRLHSGAPG